MVLAGRDGPVIVQLPFRLADAGDRLEPGTPLDTALRTGAASPSHRIRSTVSARIAIHAVGTYAGDDAGCPFPAHPRTLRSGGWSQPSAPSIGNAALAVPRWPGSSSAAASVRPRPHAQASSSETAQPR